MNVSTSQIPQLYFGSVRHTRLRPALNAFRYRVFFLRLPLRSLADSGFGCRLLSRNRFNLLSFHDADHGDGQQAPLAWIDALLREEGIADADGEIWLQTFPRVFGYVFNPVSFWFCHRPDGALRAILCEVNNTFGERHCYLLGNDGPMRFGAELVARKIFHVSPFCPVEGRYRFRFMQARRAPHDGQVNRVTARIDYDDASGPVLQTSISGSGSTLSDRVVLKALLTCPLMTFAIVFRIHWQAVRLWLRRLPWFPKPVRPVHEVSR